MTSTPRRSGDPAVERELRALEPIFHRSPAESSRRHFESMTAEDFFEVGASGRVHSRDLVLDTVARRYAEREAEVQGTLC